MSRAGGIPGLQAGEDVNDHVDPEVWQRAVDRFGRGRAIYPEMLREPIGTRARRPWRPAAFKAAEPAPRQPEPTPDRDSGVVRTVRVTPAQWDALDKPDQVRLDDEPAVVPRVRRRWFDLWSIR